MTEKEVAEHKQFSDEYHKILRETLQQTSQVFEGQAYDITDGKFNMNWQHHKNIPTLKFDFYVIVQDESVCHIEFELDSHLAHVPQTIQQNSQDENISKIIQQIRECGEKILNDNQPQLNQTLTEDILSDFEKSINNSVSEESMQSVESALQNKLDDLESRKNLELASSSNQSDEESLLGKFFKQQSSDFDENEMIKQAPELKLTRQNADMKKVFCTPQVKEIIKTHLKNLVFQNLIQDVKIFNENIKECEHKQEQNKYIYDSILQFNRERCYLRTKLQNGQVTVMTNKYQESKFMFNINENNIQNCIERFATIELLTK